MISTGLGRWINDDNNSTNDEVYNLDYQESPRKHTIDSTPSDWNSTNDLINSGNQHHHPSNGLGSYESYYQFTLKKHLSLFLTEYFHQRNDQLPTENHFNRLSKANTIASNNKFEVSNWIEKYKSKRLLTNGGGGRAGDGAFLKEESLENLLAVTILCNATMKENIASYILKLWRQNPLLIKAITVENNNFPLAFAKLYNDSPAALQDWIFPIVAEVLVHNCSVNGVRYLLRDQISTPLLNTSGGSHHLQTFKQLKALYLIGKVIHNEFPSIYFQFHVEHIFQPLTFPVFHFAPPPVTSSTSLTFGSSVYGTTAASTFANPFSRKISISSWIKHGTIRMAPINVFFQMKTSSSVSPIVSAKQGMNFPNSSTNWKGDNREMIFNSYFRRFTKKKRAKQDNHSQSSPNHEMPAEVDQEDIQQEEELTQLCFNFSEISGDLTNLLSRSTDSELNEALFDDPTLESAFSIFDSLSNDLCWESAISYFMGQEDVSELHEVRLHLNKLSTFKSSKDSVSYHNYLRIHKNLIARVLKLFISFAFPDYIVEYDWKTTTTSTGDDNTWHLVTINIEDQTISCLIDGQEYPVLAFSPLGYTHQHTLMNLATQSDLGDSQLNKSAIQQLTRSTTLSNFLTFLEKSSKLHPVSLHLAGLIAKKALYRNIARLNTIYAKKFADPTSHIEKAYHAKLTDLMSSSLTLWCLRGVLIKISIQ